jgi:hypothetical protein
MRLEARVGGGERHDAALTIWDFSCRDDRAPMLRLHFHAQTEKALLSTAQTRRAFCPHAMSRGGSQAIALEPRTSAATTVSVMSVLRNINR